MLTTAVLPLEAIVDSVWTALRRGRRDRRHHFHQPVFATRAGHDDWPAVRTVVLRYVDPDAAVLGFNTDVRSPKVAQLEEDPRCTWLFYDPSSKTQLRVRATAQVLRSGDVVDDAWRRTGLHSRRCYLAHHPPSGPMRSPGVNLPPDLLDQPPTQQRSEEGRPNFGLVRTEIVSLDWLWLSAKGHRRARFEFSRDPAGVATSDGSWVAA